MEAKSPASGAGWLKKARQLHLYLGVLFAPSIIFFALSGALQLFGLHEGHPGEKYQPPALLQKLGSIHKDQTLATKHAPPPRPGTSPKASSKEEQAKPPEEARPVDATRPPGPPQKTDRDDDQRQNKATAVLKLFFLVMSAGLIFTTGLGIYMAFKYNRSRVLVWSLLLAGAAIPAVLIAMTA